MKKLTRYGTPYIAISTAPRSIPMPPLASSVVFFSEAQNIGAAKTVFGILFLARFPFPFLPGMKRENKDASPETAFDQGGDFQDLVGHLTRIGRRDSEIITAIGQAIRENDRERVFELACSLAATEGMRGFEKT